MWYQSIAMHLNFFFIFFFFYHIFHTLSYFFQFCFVHVGSWSINASHQNWTWWSNFYVRSRSHNNIHIPGQEPRHVSQWLPHCCLVIGFLVLGLGRRVSEGTKQNVVILGRPCMSTYTIQNQFCVASGSECPLCLNFLCTFSFIQL